ncbi:hypothetical protein ACHAW5_003221 [Stephanodiscus triporus]|uniref:Amine oxidase n=1 Tax=Stephanodiscus triporus TaxID=2934178 RepID=A0ABD3QIE7_9STRA
MTTLLGERLRYLSDETLARSIITGTYDFPTELDPATKLILEEIGKLGMKLVTGEGSEIVITPEDFKRFWRRVNEFTSSSMSGVHYGHYKAAIQDDILTEVLSLQLTVVARSGIPPENWSVGLQDPITGEMIHTMGALFVDDTDLYTWKEESSIQAQYGLGTMTNDLEVTDDLLHKEDYRMLNVLGVVRSSIFLSDITTADGKYLEDAVFNPGGRGAHRRSGFPGRRGEGCRGVCLQSVDFNYYDQGCPSKGGQKILRVDVQPHNDIRRLFVSFGVSFLVVHQIVVSTINFLSSHPSSSSSYSLSSSSLFENKPLASSLEIVASRGIKGEKLDAQTLSHWMTMAWRGVAWRGAAWRGVGTGFVAWRRNGASERASWRGVGTGFVVAWASERASWRGVGAGFVGGACVGTGFVAWRVWPNRTVSVLLVGWGLRGIKWVWGKLWAGVPSYEQRDLGNTLPVY